MAFVDRVIFLAAAGGTADFVESAAVFGFQTMEAAGAVPPSHAARSSDAATVQADYAGKLSVWHTALADIHAKINVKTITSRTQIDAALAAIK